MLEKYNQLSRDFYSGKYCNVEKCKQLDQLKAEFDKKELIFAGIETSNRLLIEENNKLKQTLAEIKEIAEEQIPYLNISEAKTMIEIEYDYAGAICNLEQRMYKILQKSARWKMTNELEKKFFDTFGIKQREYTQCCSLGCKKPYTDCVNCQYHEVYKIDYPQITDYHYLQLICKLSGVCCPHFAFERDISELKETILKFCIHYKDQLKHQVRTLFKEG